MGIDDLLGKVWVGDVMDWLPLWPDGSVNCCITSPPYNAGMDYGLGIDDARPWPEYEEWARVWVGEIGRVLSEGGRLALVVAAGIGRSPWFPLASMYTQVACSVGLLPRAEIIWDKGPSQNSSTAWGSWCSPSNPQIRDSHEAILIFSKGAWALPNPRQEKSDLLPAEFPDLTRSLWRVPCETNRAHPAPFPERLAERLIRLYTWRGDTVIDPFMGSGTVGLVAEKHGRGWAGCDLNADYAKMAEERIAREREQCKLFPPG